MANNRRNYEAVFYEALKRIAAYQTPAQLRRSSERQWGVVFDEAIEMAYENLQCEAQDALKGYRKPKVAEGSR